MNQKLQFRVLNVYSTLGCHLCDLALDIIHQSPKCSSLKIDIVDIADDNDLVELYGIRIPVVKDVVSDTEISWPFSTEAFEGWLDQL